MYASANLLPTNQQNATDSVTLTLYQNNAETPATCTATSGALHTPVNSTCTFNPVVSFAAGDTIGLQWSHTNPNNNLYVQYGAGIQCQ
jgi:hypothetical protein